MAKAIAFKKPGGKKQAKASTDDWVATRQAEPDQMKRFTIDVTAELHTRIKMDCASRGVKMSDEIRALLEGAFPAR
jgi:hypothetical protein